MNKSYPSQHLTSGSCHLRHPAVRPRYRAAVQRQLGTSGRAARASAPVSPAIGMLGWIVAFACSVLSVPFVSADQVGVLILAHGGTGRWNQTVEQTVAEAQLPYPTEIAFGMGMHPAEVQQMQEAINKPQRRRVDRIIVVPLLISSASEVMRQFQYLLKLRSHGPWESQARPLDLRTPVVMTTPLDDDPVVSDVLVDRARELSQNAQEETVIMIAHGPNSDDDNAQWLAVMDRLAKRVQTKGHFSTVVPVTMRDDAPKPVQETATRQMRELVQQQSTQGRILVIPLLLANGGVEDKIPQRLQGLTYVYSGRALLPHPQLAQWIAHQVQTHK